MSFFSGHSDFGPVSFCEDIPHLSFPGKKSKKHAIISAREDGMKLLIVMDINILNSIYYM